MILSENWYPLMRALPLAGDTEQHPHAPAFLAAARLGRLDHQLIDEEEWHAGLELVEQLLQGRLIDLAACNEAHVTLLRLAVFEFDLGGEHVTAHLGDRSGDPLLERRARDRHRRA